MRAETAEPLFQPPLSPRELGLRYPRSHRPARNQMTSVLVYLIGWMVHCRRRPAPNQMMLLSDMVLAWDPEFRKVLELYAEDEDLLAVDFGKAFKKLT